MYLAGLVGGPLALLQQRPHTLPAEQIIPLLSSGMRHYGAMETFTLIPGGMRNNPTTVCKYM